MLRKNFQVVQNHFQTVPNDSRLPLKRSRLIPNTSRMSLNDSRVPPNDSRLSLNTSRVAFNHFSGAQRVYDAKFDAVDARFAEVDAILRHLTGMDNPEK